VVIRNGVLGPSALQPVEMVFEIAAALAPIPLQMLKEKTARNWDLTRKLKNAIMATAQVCGFLN